MKSNLIKLNNNQPTFIEISALPSKCDCFNCGAWSAQYIQLDDISRFFGLACCRGRINQFSRHKVCWIVWASAKQPILHKLYFIYRMAYFAKFANSTPPRARPGYGPLSISVCLFFHCNDWLWVLVVAVCLWNHLAVTSSMHCQTR